ncbi:MAG: hypothetical protein WC378_17490 [Opitutaceae bacterium]|jgi:hypothetical protein
MNPENEKDLEQFIHRSLRSLPERRAPLTLEHRVMAAIAARQSIPWWHKSYAYWPLPVKIAFLSASLLVLAGIYSLHIAGGSALRDWLHSAAAHLNPLRITANAIGDSGAIVYRSIPPLYIYGALAVIGSLYAALFGLGAAAYRTLFSNR